MDPIKRQGKSRTDIMTLNIANMVILDVSTFKQPAPLNIPSKYHCLRPRCQTVYCQGPDYVLCIIKSRRSDNRVPKDSAVHRTPIKEPHV